MLLAEGLAARKQALVSIKDLSARWQTAAVRYEDAVAESEDPASLQEQLDTAIDDFRVLSERINRTNNATTITFDGQSLTIMEAVALRELLLLRAKHYRATADAVVETLSGSSRYYGKRTKDDIKQVAAIDIAEVRNVADRASKRVRELDIVLQQKNWTTDLLD